MDISSIAGYLLALIVFGWMGWVIYILLNSRNEEPKNKGSSREYDINP